jgi:16S rRNA (guanine527-N7)-methyltransferase
MSFIFFNLCRLPAITMSEEFIEAVKKHQNHFGLNLPDRKISALADYYEFVQTNNPLLHLVAPCTPEEFAVRHILESLTLLEFLPKNAKLADVGAGAGLPSIPCLIARDDLRAVLIELKLKKAKFLEECLAKFELKGRARVFDRQFEEMATPRPAFITCRALDKFTQKLPRLLKWSQGSSMLFFGGNSLRDELKKCGVRFEEKLLPLSEQRFLFIAKPKTDK